MSRRTDLIPGPFNRLDLPEIAFSGVRQGRETTPHWRSRFPY